MSTEGEERLAAEMLVALAQNRAYIHQLEMAVDDLNANIGIKEYKDLLPQTQALCRELHQRFWHLTD